MDKDCLYCGGTGEVFSVELGTGIPCSYCLGTGKEPQETIGQTEVTDHTKERTMLKIITKKA
jgi:reverse gyrase